MMIRDLVKDAPAPHHLKARIVNALVMESASYAPAVDTVEGLVLYLHSRQNTEKPWRNGPRAILERIPNFGRKSADVLLPLMEQYLAGALDLPGTYLVDLPISEDEADVIGMPAEMFAKAVRTLGRRQ